MNDHPHELLLEAYVDGSIPADERAVIAMHIERCGDCAAYVQRVRSLAQSLRTLPRTAQRVPPFAARRRTAPWVSMSALRAAAVAALIFSAGVAVGTATRGAPGEPSPPPTEIRPALDVQRAGTSYIAALARLNASGDDAPAVYGREVALATLYGAAAEAVAPLRTDAEASELLELARVVRDRAALSSPTERTQ